MAGIRIKCAVIALATLAPLALSGCVTGEPRRVAVALTETVPPPTPEPTLELTPAAGAKDVPASTEIGVTATNGTVSDATVLDSDNNRVTGTMRADGSSWVPDKTLEYGESYTATITVTGDGGTATKSTTFAIMAKPATKQVKSTSLYLTSGKTYGVAMPVVVTFESDVPDSARATIQRRLFVTSQPAQNGAWRWFGARSVMYRPETYWQPGTKLTVRSALGGLPIGKMIGDTDRSATVTIGRDFRIQIENSNKRMSVVQNGQVIKTIPVSLGKASTPSSSGTTVIISKEADTVFDTTLTDGPDGYRIAVKYAQRLTWGGEYIHSAPWSVGDQGRRNVSHGCVNVSPGNASWLFSKTLIGDPVTTRGTTRKLAAGNGWTVWNMTWAEYTSS
ncbi:MAG: L,D-transpeptidase family protein [Micromonosporaceae bacterium]|nr:L,D-transpeptidase family protein [Micromonosporaceae bacterium]